MLLLALLFLVSIKFYESELRNRRAEEIDKNNSLARDIASMVSKGFIKRDITKSVENIAEYNKDGSILYAIFFDAKENFLGGFTNTGAEAKKILSEMGYMGDSISSFMKRMLKTDLSKFKERLDFVKIKFVKRGRPDSEMLGGVKIAVAMPFSSFEKFFLYKPHIHNNIALCIIALIALNFIIGRRKSKYRRKTRKIKSVPNGSMSPIEDVVETSIVDEHTPSQDEEVTAPENQGADLLSMEIDRSYKASSTQEFTQEDLDKADKEGWINIFNGWDLDDWEIKGKWYVSNNMVVGIPWQSSLVRTDIEHGNYDLEFKFKKITGTDGCIVIFKCSDKCHAWVIGGWKGKRSEVMRIEETVTTHSIAKETWYNVRISVLDNVVEGFINGEEVFSVPREVFESTPSQSEFMTGIGIGVWNTMCKFKDIHFLRR